MTDENVQDTVSRREHVRLQLVDGVRALIRIVNVNGEWIKSNPNQVLLKNISQGGCGFQCSNEFPINYRFLMEIELISENERLQLIGQVVWRKSEDNSYFYGMYFRLTLHDRLQLQRVLNQMVLRLSPGLEIIHSLYRSHYDSNHR
jgi:Tfp pilus assembly protein PilZ